MHIIPVFTQYFKSYYNEVQLEEQLSIDKELIQFKVDIFYSGAYYYAEVAACFIR